jgi:hypothetical protein
MTISGLQAVTTALWVLAGTWLRSISRHTIHISIIGSKYGKIAIYRPGTFVRGIPVTFVDGEYMLEVGLSFVSIRFYGMVDTGRYC